MKTSAGWMKFGKVPLGMALGALALLVVVRGDHLLISVIALVGVAVAAYEVSCLLGRRMSQRVLLSVTVVASCLVSKWLLGGSRESVNEFMFLALLAWLAIAPMSLARPLHPSRSLQATLWGFYLVSAWLAVAVLAEYDRWMLIVGLAAVCLTDTCAWFFGSRLGKKPLAPVISPNKSWEGVYGALLGLLVFAFILWWFFLEGIYSHWLVLLVASAVTALAVVGDLVESAFKRDVQVKDSGVLMGSHGGILDRIDSWLPVLPFLALLSTLSP